MSTSVAFSLVAATWLALPALQVLCAPNNLPSCFTPSQQFGRCMHSSKCGVYERAYEEFGKANVEYFRLLQCGTDDEDSKVCCPETGSYNVSEIIQFTQMRLPEREEIQDQVGLRFRRSHSLPGVKMCGIQTIGDRIFGGNITEIDEFPWMALLFYRLKMRSQDYHFACGGVLISDRYVLTAAHCVYGKDVERLGGLEKVRLGEYNVDTARDCVIEMGFEDCSDDPVDITPESISIHPGFNPNATHLQNDIALIRLSKKVRFSFFIKPICLPNTNVFKQHKISPGDRLFVSGWGKTETGLSSPVKLKLDIPVVNMNECEHVYRRRFKIKLDDTQVCAGGEKDKDSCKGDSGGPLMVADPAFGNWIVAGVVSIGPNICGKSGIPGIYTDVKRFMPWILNTIED